MEKFILQGHSTGHFSGSKMFRIYLPPAKHFEPPTTDPYLLPPAHAMKELSLDETADQKVKLLSQAVYPKSRFKQHQHFNNKVLSEVYSRHSGSCCSSSRRSSANPGRKRPTQCFHSQNRIQT